MSMLTKKSINTEMIYVTTQNYYWLIREKLKRQVDNEPTRKRQVDNKPTRKRQVDNKPTRKRQVVNKPTRN